MTDLLLIPLDDVVVFPNMSATLSVDVGEESEVLLVPRHDGTYASVGTVASVGDRVRLPGGAASLVFHPGGGGLLHCPPLYHPSRRNCRIQLAVNSRLG